MFKKCLEACTDYKVLCKESMTWMKKHWKGYAVICIAAFALPIIYEQTKYKINSKRLLAKEDESQR